MDGIYDHASHIETALVENEATRHAVVASWQRSKTLYKLNPNDIAASKRLSNRELGFARERLGSLIPIAEPNLDYLYRAIGNAGCCVLLADGNGITVTRRGSPSDDDTFSEWGLWTGTSWNEGCEGTNGIGTCIAEERALTIHKDQHFHTKNIAMSCTAAPIFDDRGALIAAIDVSSCRADLTSEFSNLISIAVSDAARRIETEHFRQSFANSRIILATAPSNFGVKPTGYQSTALVAVDNDDLVVGASRQARRIFGLNDEKLKRPLPLSTLFGQNIDQGDAYLKAGRRTILHALASTGGNVSEAAQSMGICRSTLHRKIKRFNINTRSK